jgi:hypothetical protein
MSENDGNENLSVDNSEMPPEVAAVNNDPDLRRGAQQNWENSWMKISAEHYVQQQQAALTRLRQAVTELRVAKAHPSEAAIAACVAKYHDELAAIEPLSKEMTEALSPVISNAAWQQSLADQYRREMLARDVQGRPDKVKAIKEKFARKGLAVDQVQIYGGR